MTTINTSLVWQKAFELEGPSWNLEEACPIDSSLEAKINQSYSDDQRSTTYKLCEKKHLNRNQIEFVFQKIG